MLLYVIIGSCVRVEKGFYCFSIHNYFYDNAGSYTVFGVKKWLVKT